MFVFFIFIFLVHSLLFLKWSQREREEFFSPLEFYLFIFLVLSYCVGISFLHYFSPLRFEQEKLKPCWIPVSKKSSKVKKSLLKKSFFFFEILILFYF